MLSESKIYKHYYHIQEYPLYVINKNGDVINIVTGNHIHPTNIHGYYTFPLLDKYNHKRFIKRSRLLCMVFKPINNPNYFVIDHINCNKTDDRLQNLEWVTPKQNTIRARNNGLLKKSNPIRIRNFQTKQIKQYATFNEAARQLNLSDAALTYRLQSQDGRVFPQGLQYKYQSDMTNWKDMEDLNAYHFLYGNQKRIYLKDLNTGFIIEYQKLSDAAKALNMPLSTLSSYINKSQSKQPILPNLIQLKFVNDKRDWIEFEDPWLQMQKITGRPLIQVQNNKTGQIKIFKSQADCARQMHCLTTTLNNRLRMRDNTVVYADGFRYGYYPY